MGKQLAVVPGLQAHLATNVTSPGADCPCVREAVDGIVLIHNIQSGERHLEYHVLSDQLVYLILNSELKVKQTRLKKRNIRHSSSVVDESPGFLCAVISDVGSFQRLGFHVLGIIRYLHASVRNGGIENKFGT